MMKVLVCGGRDFRDEDLIRAELDRIKPSVVMQGGCPTGADIFAKKWALEHPEIGCWTFMANWDGEGRKAGPLRNQRMVDEGNPDLVLAFPGGKGTTDLCRRAFNAGIPITTF